MMCTPHILAGAAVAKLLRRPVLAYPAAFATHLALDVVPHLDAHGMFGVPHGGPTTAEAATAVADFVVGAALLVWLASGKGDATFFPARREPGPLPGKRLRPLFRRGARDHASLPGKRLLPPFRLLLWGGFCGIVLDLVDNVPPWGPHFQTWAGTAWFSAFHHGIQHNLTPAQWPLGFATQAAVVALAVWVLTAKMGRNLFPA